ncbi:hypothetical protein PGTUg99_033654 [Puccinia graminis f. sp. tritici]|uniref:Uncharacterized protein n=1 Tax=Puccinia graminis f. sp. tritici TaxID=56615 RepID=A0A5B0SFC3_PUCGR|nr:hypothetical protein PGTUg99_033654 [Puccinia graminis f. sp. tritici]
MYFPFLKLLSLWRAALSSTHISHFSFPNHSTAMSKSYCYYRCPHNPTCRDEHSIGNKPCQDCVGMNRYQVRYHTAREELHRACDPTCPVYKLDSEWLIRIAGVNL